MKKACLVVDKYLQNNAIFDKGSQLNRDNIFDKYINLQSEFKKQGYELATNDINKISESEVILYFDMPKVLPKKAVAYKSYLILVESSLIRPDNYQSESHVFFNKIFTWNDELVDEKKYFKLNFSHLFPDSINKDLSKKEKLCMLISGNKNSPKEDERELYSKRKEAIRWFEKNHPDDFDLYGVGWDKYKFSGAKIIRGLNLLPLLGAAYARLANKTYPSYKGKVDNKKRIMEKYKFSICYENAKNMPGYITEKIFDSFFAGCVPVYWGANNITDHIPRECFIDKRNFGSYEELYDYIRNMRDYEYLEYLRNIEKYLESAASFSFTGVGFSKNLVAQIVSE